MITSSTGGTAVLVDGRIPDADEVADFALVNDGHFTAVQVRGGAARGVELHLDRMVAAHRSIYGTELDRRRLRSLMALAVADRPDCYLRVTIGEFEAGRPRVMTAVRAPIERSATAVSLVPVVFTRPFPQVKHVGSLPQIWLGRQAERNGYDDALLIAPDGRISETTIANIAFVADGHVVWPDGPALHGITWQLLDRALDAARQQTSIDRVTLDDLGKYPAAVLANSIGVSPVGSIGSHTFAASSEAAERLERVYRDVRPERVDPEGN